MNQNLGQLEFIDPGYGYEIAMADMGFSASDFAWDPGIDYFAGVDIGSFQPETFTPVIGTGPAFEGAYPMPDVSQESIANVTGGVATTAGGAASGIFGSGISINDVLNAMKGGLTLYQAYEQIQAQKAAAERGLTTTATRTGTTATAPAGYVRTASGQYVNPLTGQVYTPPGTTAPGAAGGELIPGVPNWALLAGAAGVAVLLFMPRGRKR